MDSDEEGQVILGTGTHNSAFPAEWRTTMTKPTTEPATTTHPAPLDGATLIAAERRRQVDAEGYDAEHDSKQRASLVFAGIAYAIAALEPSGPSYAAGDWWPWGSEAWKPTGDVVRDLTKAGALIAAAIDAERAAARKEGPRE